MFKIRRFGVIKTAVIGGVEIQLEAVQPPHPRPCGVGTRRLLPHLRQGRQRQPRPCDGAGRDRFNAVV